jgi:fibronectin type 3 domain-containing protein
MLAGGTVALVNYDRDRIPLGVTASIKGLRRITLGWERPQARAKLYRIERARLPTGPFESIGTANPREQRYVDRGTAVAPLEDSTTYYYRIVALLGRRGESMPSRVVSGTTGAAPAAGDGVKAVASGPRAVTLSWRPSPSAEIVKYRIERRPAAAGEYVTIAETEGGQYVDGGTAQSTLKDSTEYLYRVTAVNSAGAQSKPMQFPRVKTLPPPSAVKGLVATGDQVRCVPLAWQPSPEEDIVGYDIYRLNRAGGKYDLIGHTDGRERTSFLDGGGNPGNLADNQTYSYRVRAVNSVAARSPDSETVRVTTHAVPQRVQNVAAQSDLPRKVVVTWTRSQDHSAVGYEIWCAAGSGDFARVGRVDGRDVTTFTYRGASTDPSGLGALKDNTEYTFKIVQFNVGRIRSSASEAAKARTKKLPAAPAGVKATTGLPRAVNISWRANPEPDITHYVVEVSDRDSEFTRLADIAVTDGAKAYLARETGLLDGVQRNYRVRAVDADRLGSPWSATVSGRTKPAPGVPTALRMRKTTGGIRVEWTPPSQADIREYAVWKKNLFAWEFYETTAPPWIVFLEDELRKPVTFKVSAIDKDNLESGHSESITVEARP